METKYLIPITWIKIQPALKTWNSSYRSMSIMYLTTSVNTTAWSPRPKVVGHPTEFARLPNSPPSNLLVVW